MSKVSHMLTLLVFGFVFARKGEAAGAEILSLDVSKLQYSSRSAWDKQVTDYWTADKMRAAKALEYIQSNNTFSPGPNTTSVKKLANADGPLVKIEPARFNDSATQSRLISAANQAVKTAGKLFFRTRNGDATCSASVVTAPSYSLVITAAHCLFDLSYRVWYSNWVFVPAYDARAAPLGVWPAKYAQLLTAYSASSAYSPNWNYDVGFLVLNTVSSRRIAQAVGAAQGIIFNGLRYQLTYSFGYPANIASGEIMSACVSRPVSPTCIGSQYAGQALRCGMTQGCSGGPWISSLNVATGLGYIYSVNSFVCNSSPYMLHGPYFDNNIRYLYDSIKSKV